MRNDRCPGCGAPFQRDDPSRPGYLPPDLPPEEGLVCRRCYRLTHYGRDEGRPLSAAEARRRVEEAVARASAVLFVADLADFEGSLPPRGLLPSNKPVLLAVNKIDLLPPKAVAAEVMAWAGRRWREARSGPPAAAVVGVSGAKGIGLRSLVEEARRIAGYRGGLALVGATSVGKSTLLRRLLPEGGPGPTVARFPGTTQAATRWDLPEAGLFLYDTPGLLPGDRLIDLLCPACAGRIIPARRLGSKLFRLEPGGAVLIGGFASFVLEGGEPRLVLAYAGEEVLLHRTSAAKAEALLAEGPEWLAPGRCESCRRLPFAAPRTVVLEALEDLAVAGLGWISLRGGPAPIRVTIPGGVRLAKRPALFGPRRIRTSVT